MARFRALTAAAVALLAAVPVATAQTTGRPVAGLDAASQAAAAASAANAVWDVIVVGSGVSGVAAAARARLQGRSVLILEGRNRTGGRLWSHREWGYAVDLGASWIHGVTGNPIAALAQRYAIPTFVTDYDNAQLFTASGSGYSDSAAAAVSANYAAMMAVVANATAVRRAAGAPDVPLQSLIDDALAARTSDTATTRAGLSYSVTSTIEHEFAADAAWLSAYHYDNSSRVRGGDVVFPRGYDDIIAVLLGGDAAGATVLLNQNVTGVTYGGCGRGLPATVRTAAGVTYTARTVVVTVPLGQLLRGAIAFQPPLPAALSASMGRLAMGTLNKYALEFAGTPNHATSWRWPSADILMYNRVGVARWDNMWPEWLNWQHVSSSAVSAAAGVTPRRMLIGFASGSFAYNATSQSDEAVQRQLVDLLTTLFGTGLGQPTRFMRTAWDADPWTWGSYSYTPVNATPADRGAFAGGAAHACVQFAGEHTSVRNPATVHGAYTSGLEAGDRVLAALAILAATATPTPSPSAATSVAPGTTLARPFTIVLPALWLNAPPAAVAAAVAGLRSDLASLYPLPGGAAAFNITLVPAGGMGGAAATATRVEVSAELVANQPRPATSPSPLPTVARPVGASLLPAPTPAGEPLPSAGPGATQQQIADAAALLASVAGLQARAGGTAHAQSNVAGLGNGMTATMLFPGLLADLTDVLGPAAAASVAVALSLSAPVVAPAVFAAVTPSSTVSAAATPSPTVGLGAGAATGGASTTASAAAIGGGVGGAVGGLLLVALLAYGVHRCRGAGKGVKPLTSTSPAHSGGRGAQADV
jgi:monoamine oxidase